MSVELIPVELDIDNALDEVSRLRREIESVFRTHGSTDDPRMENLLRQMRTVHQELGNIREQMRNIDFDPNINQTLEIMRNRANDVSTALEQTRNRVRELREYMGAANFNFNIGEDIANVNAQMQSMQEPIQESRNRVEELNHQLDELGGFDPTIDEKLASVQTELQNITQEASQAREQADALQQSLVQSKGEIPSPFKKSHFEDAGSRNLLLNAPSSEGSDLRAWQDAEKAALASQNRINEVSSAVQKLASQSELQHAQQQETERLQELTNGYAELGQSRQNLLAQQQFQNPFIEQLQQEEENAQNLDSQLTSLNETIAETQTKSDIQDALTTRLQNATEAANILDHRLQQMHPPTGANNALMVMNSLANAVNTALIKVANAIKTVFSKLHSLAQDIVSKIKSAFSTLLTQVKSLASHIGSSLSNKFGSLGKSANKMTNSLEGGFKKAFKMLLRYGLGVRSLFFLFRKLRAAAIASLGEMAKQIPEVNKQMSSL